MTEGSKSGNKEGLKTKTRCKVAVEICNRLQGKSNLNVQEVKRLTWTRNKLKNGRTHFATRNWCNASGTAFANRIEEHIAEKRQRSIKSEPKMPSNQR